MLVYKVTNLINNKIYVGLTTRTLEERIKEHTKNSKYTEYAFHRAIRKYGINNFNFEIIDNATCLEELIRKESNWINKLDSMNPIVGYNMINQQDRVKIISDESKDKISVSNKNRLNSLSKEEKSKIYLKSSISRQGIKRGTNKYIGVFPVKNCSSFECHISYRNKRYRKSFKLDIDAAEAYDKLALFIYGKEAKLNFENKKDNYLKEDLEEFINKFLIEKQKLGRPKNEKPMV